MEYIINLINSTPKFIWENFFSVFETIGCGLIVAYFTSTYLKKKEERTRIAGVIVEKRINAEQEILHFLEYEFFKEEININNSSKYDFKFDDLLKEYGLSAPYKGHMQFAKVFKSPVFFRKFFHEFEDYIMIHKLWLDDRVKEHLVFMQIYFSFFNNIPLMIKRIPLPEGQELTDDEFNDLHSELLLIFGACCDAEINILMSELDEKIVDSVYKLDLSRPEKSIIRDNMYNVDMEKCLKRFNKKTIPGQHKEKIIKLIMDFVHLEKNIDVYRMRNEEYEEFFKASMPEEYQKCKNNIAAFKEELENIFKDEDIRIVSKEELDKYPEMFGISLQEILDGKEPIRNKDRRIE